MVTGGIQSIALHILNQSYYSCWLSSRKCCAPRTCQPSRSLFREVYRGRSAVDKESSMILLSCRVCLPGSTFIERKPNVPGHLLQRSKATPPICHPYPPKSPSPVGQPPEWKENGGQLVGDYDLYNSQMIALGLGEWVGGGKPPHNN